MTVNLLDFDAAGLTVFFAGIGEKPFRAKQVLRWMHRFGQSDFDAMTDIAKSLREKLKAIASVTPPAIVSDKLSDDGTRKFLFDVGGSNAVETVFIPEDDRGTLCISTQAGCALGGRAQSDSGCHCAAALAPVLRGALSTKHWAIRCAASAMRGPGRTMVYESTSLNTHTWPPLTALRLFQPG